MRDDRARLLDILEAIDNIQRRAAPGREVYMNDELLQVWMVHHIQIIGEAAGGLSRTLREQYPEIPWGDIVSMRNILVHQYFGIDLEQVWATVITDLPRLHSEITHMLREMDDRP